MDTHAVLVLFAIISVCGAQRWKQDAPQWNPKDPGSSRKCSNLTQVLDNWKFAIVTRVRELLINDHASVLPEYNRIRPLSEALGDLYRRFDSLKGDLGRLAAKLDGVEAFVDELSDGRLPAPRRPAPRTPPGGGLRAPLRAQMKSPDRRVLTMRARRRRPGRA
ncbi:uncharacterized protein si:dkey-282h22.5 [Betta splendens]|uniref:Uncharacterized protein si:dkey-282h22.5 n=1 Tax=Betta splendens TaxID=158456 RepID=A0A8M1HH73_BETSP|nr:uncharacterized protein si:dkey-282h22.5 [Betta splendens]